MLCSYEILSIANCEVLDACAPATLLLPKLTVITVAMKTIASYEYNSWNYNSIQEDRASYTERLQQYFAANNVAEYKQQN